MKVVIYGLSKSGTSALFYRIADSLQGRTICLFEPTSRGIIKRLRVRVKAALLGQTPPNVLAKVLPFEQKPVRVRDFSTFDKQILIVRDPRDRLISQLLYQVYDSTMFWRDADVRSFIDLLRRKEAAPESVSIKSLLETYQRLEGDSNGLLAWSESFQGRRVEEPLRFHEQRPNLHAVRYEDMIDERLEALENYLGMKLVAGATVHEAVQRVTRTKSYGGWRNWFTAADVETFGALLQPFLDRYYPNADWTLGRKPALDPQHGSGYVLKVANERRRIEGLAAL